ncbi:MAG: hypothetical protein LBG22_02000 [Treponema sp.]|jgi:hypothetical protein|nr:hypothetical protein [Treponema sp.]
MRPADHFLSLLSRCSAGQDGSSLKSSEFDYLKREFSSLVSPVLGRRCTEEFFERARERIEQDGGSPSRLGAAAAFFLQEFDDRNMELKEEDWEDIRETLNEASEEIDLEILTKLMAALLERGKLYK